MEPEPLKKSIEEAEKLFGLEKGYSLKDLHKARNKLSLSLHPDRGGSHDEVKNQFSFFFAVIYNINFTYTIFFCR